MLPQSELKKVLKEALTETLIEQRDLLHELLAEVLEDIAMADAITEGRKTGYTSREEIFKLLNRDQ